MTYIGQVKVLYPRKAVLQEAEVDIDFSIQSCKESEEKLLDSEILPPTLTSHFPDKGKAGQVAAQQAMCKFQYPGAEMWTADQPINKNTQGQKRDVKALHMSFFRRER